MASNKNDDAELGRLLLKVLGVLLAIVIICFFIDTHFFEFIGTAAGKILGWIIGVAIIVIVVHVLQD